MIKLFYRATIWCMLLMALLSSKGAAQGMIRGRVMSPDSAGLPGAVIKVKDQNLGAITDEQGEFRLPLTGNSADLLISYIGFLSVQVHVDPGIQTPLTITLLADPNQLGEVVVSTGYQNIPTERITGSFSGIDNTLLNRRVSPDILSRLEDAAPGLIFNKGKGWAAKMIIRGQSTINSSSQPLIIVDNFPYEGDINMINPNDVESVTILKDAAAASIWGSRAGNGVIVITTKKGSANQPARISVNSNITIGARPDLFYQPVMSTADFIESEKQAFAAGRYTWAETNPNKYPFTPVIELLIAKRNGTMTAAQADGQIEALKTNDVRSEIERYLYRPSVNQQYSISVRGGNQQQRYFVSAGYDRAQANEVGRGSNRFTINANNSYFFARNKLELTTGIYFSESSNVLNDLGAITYTNGATSYTGTPLYPYASLMGLAGEHLPLINQYRLSFADQAISQGLMDWSYRPLDELQTADNTTKLTDYRINTALNYKIVSGLSLSVLYQYSRGMSSTRNYFSEQTYFTRNEINRFSSVDAAGVLTRPVPTGGIIDMAESSYFLHTVRGQLEYRWRAGAHELNAMGGWELRDLGRTGNTSRLYGFDAEHASSKIVNYITPFVSYVNPASSGRILNRDTRYGEADRYLSYYANGAYTFKRRYVASASARLDQSNLYGVKANQQGVPLYSAGIAWNLSDEGFYHISWLPFLKLRATFGYGGNSNKNVSAYTTAAFSGSVDSNTGQGYASIINPPNPQLRWERIRTINVGLDFETRNRVLAGSLEYYAKKGMDLIGSMPYPGSSGVTNFTGNYAQTKGHGIDLTINARLVDKVFKWNSTFLLSLAKDKVAKYGLIDFASNYLGSADGVITLPLEGRPLYSVYSLAWAGLDPKTGDPMGYLNGEISKNYAAMTGIPAKDMVYNGPSRPTVFGALRNTFSWKGLSATLNVNYRLGHYFRSRSVNYQNVASAIFSHADYSQRWKSPGDERITSVPSMPQAINADRNNFYLFSQVLVHKADHVRFQDVTLSYQLPLAASSQLPVSAVQIYFYANNIGMIWKSFKGAIDPNYSEAAYLPVRSLSIGAKFDF